MPLDALLGPLAAELAERVATAPDWHAAASLVDRALAARVRDAPPVEPGTAWAVETLRASGGALPVAGLARELGWSHRRLIARFRRDVGLPPKTVARIMRLERLRGLLAGEPWMGWARVAAACGFADQAHLSREVRDLTGLTPTELRRR